MLTTVTGNFTVVSTGTGDIRLGNTASGDLTIGGNFSQTGGTFRVSNGGDRNVTVAGGFSLTGGTLDLDDSSDAVNFNVGGDFSQTGGTLTQGGSGSSAGIIFDKAGVQNYTAAGTISGAVNVTVNSGSTLNLDTNITMGSGTFTVNGILNCAANYVGGAGKFTLASGGELQMGSAAGISASGTTGNIQVTGTRTFNTGGNYAVHRDGRSSHRGRDARHRRQFDDQQCCGRHLDLRRHGQRYAEPDRWGAGHRREHADHSGRRADFRREFVQLCQRQFATHFQHRQRAVRSTFPIGDAANYLPLSLASMNVTHAGNITVKTVGAEHPNIATSLIDANVDVTRYWTITNGGSLAATYNATFNYSANDPNVGANPAQFIAQDYNGSNWASATLSGTPTTTTATISGQASFGDFAFGDPKGNQTITFPAIGNQTYGVAPITLGATASSGLPVSYSVTGPANIANGILTITGAASVTVTASPGGECGLERRHERRRRRSPLPS